MDNAINDSMQQIFNTLPIFQNLNTSNPQSLLSSLTQINDPSLNMIFNNNNNDSST